MVDEFADKSAIPDVDESETDEKIRERELKRIEEMSRHLDDDFLGTTQEERDQERKQYVENKLGKSKATNGSPKPEEEDAYVKAISEGIKDGTGAAGAKAMKVKKISLLVQDASEAILSKYRFLTIEETDQLWYYENGVYKKGGKILVAKELEAQYGYELNDHSLSQAIGHIKRRSYHKHEELDADIDIINLKSGLYHISENRLSEHTPDYLSIKQKPITHDNYAKPERFLEFISEVVYEHDTPTAIDIAAYTFRRDYDIEAIFKLYGLGNNGKTVYTSIITAMHGADNVSNVPLDKLLKNDFAISDLEGKDVNIDNELGRQNINETAMLKRLTSGSRQRNRIERKNIPAYDAILYAKLIFNANMVPDSTDKSDAYSRRLIILSFPYRFEGTNEDKELTSKLIAEKEKSGIFNILMDALRRIIETKEIRVNEKTIEERRAKYERAVNPLGCFYDEAIAADSKEDNFVEKMDVHNAYVKFCEKHGLPSEKYDHFCKLFKNKFNLKDYKPRDPKNKDNRLECWKGILLVPEYAAKTPQTVLEIEES